MQPLVRNADVDWNLWPVDDYLAEIYRDLHPSDDAVIEHHSAFYRAMAPDSIATSLELGTGPNLYPLMLAAAVSRRIDAVEPSTASLAYLERQLRGGADPSWAVFYERCRQLQPALPTTLEEALSRVHVRRGGAADLPVHHYDLGSMHFVAESCTEDFDEFRDICRLFARSVRPGGYLIAAFMENMGRYQVGTGPQWPGCRVDQESIHAAFAPLTSDLSTSRVDFDTTGPDYGYTGMVLITAVR
jgi:SAM-dependent methyltransferase